jgi:hypothetical protein
MKLSERIKEIYFDENIPVPLDFEDRFRSLIVLDHTTDREIFLTMSLNDILKGSIHDKDLFHKYDLELMQLRKEKNK